ncbi:uncharacterized protein BYT42DRAFT_256178 [Radiomyces spectabilis]|uniref:uncharacterized protein n=1 Tax=Radiomyces spectabilis TaxID=64574 RepID=UPI00221F7B4D|nr:uncharacterized protein BYT42DRAFT_256178 [Radiomyces spectabilis]KAI8384300.1 hypothetical protein BYT42DRAFT_256178 [Radiomyces spectabilis]
MTFDFEERRGNLLTCVSPSESLVLCVSEDLRMSKGIAVAFRQQFGGLQQLQAQKKSVGQVAHLAISPKRHVFYLITRHKAYNKASYGDLERCLMELRKMCETLGVLHLALPHELGVGLDGFQEKYVKEVIFKVFHGWQGKMIMYQSDE